MGFLLEYNPKIFLSLTDVFYISCEKNVLSHSDMCMEHDDVIKWTHFPRYWPFVRGIHWSPANSRHKGQWRVALMFAFICVWINGGVNNREAGDLRHYRAHYDVSVMATVSPIQHVRDFADYLSIICGITFLFVITIWFVVDTYVVSASCWENLSLL